MVLIGILLYGDNGADPGVVKEIEERIKQLQSNQTAIIVDGLAGGDNERKLSLISARLAEKYKADIQKRIDDLIKKQNNGKTLSARETVLLQRLPNIQEGIDRSPEPKPKNGNNNNENN